mgnify:CR=1 FL=1
MPCAIRHFTKPRLTGLSASFDAARIKGEYSTTDGLWRARVNGDTLAIWGKNDWLSRCEVVTQYASLPRPKSTRYKLRIERPQTGTDAGNMIHHAVLLGLVY